ncbi:MAG: hypothetical protein JXB04_08935, partial [Kiritimatiellae bacterium]|nr:hypothetical protein [Kiritimatiellia bacterium]
FSGGPASTPAGGVDGSGAGVTAPSKLGEIWQRDVWDTQMRDYAHYVEKCAYVERNPVRRGLVQRPEDWPYRGELHVIRW